MPIGVVAPRTIESANRAIAIARDEGVSVTARGGGTSQAGQTVSTSLVVDCSKYLNRILQLDVAERRCVVEPGIVLDDLNRQLKPHGLWFPVDISTASRATVGGMTANNSCGARSLRYGNTRENVLSVDAVLADGTLAHFGQVNPDLSDIPDPSPAAMTMNRTKRTARRPTAGQRGIPAWYRRRSIRSRIPRSSSRWSPTAAAACRRSRAC